MRYGFIHIGKTGGTAAKAVLDQFPECNGNKIFHFTHRYTLRKVIERDMVDQVFFFIREPVARFISAFNSRYRKGQPRYFYEWSRDEKTAFSRFQSPTELAEGLGSEDEETSAAAHAAMTSILHCRNAYEYYLDSVETLRRYKDRIAFIGAQETMDADFKRLAKFLGLPVAEVPSDDVAAHKTPAWMDKKLSRTGVDNILKYYAADLPIYEWCVQRRKELLDQSIG